MKKLKTATVDVRQRSLKIVEYKPKTNFGLLKRYFVGMLKRTQ
jgi:hypothetical protein